MAAYSTTKCNLKKKRSWNDSRLMTFVPRCFSVGYGLHLTGRRACSGHQGLLACTSSFSEETKIVPSLSVDATNDRVSIYVRKIHFESDASRIVSTARSIDDRLRR
jgi:hypothetical protein